jgi:uridine nucleosidase
VVLAASEEMMRTLDAEWRSDMMADAIVEIKAALMMQPKGTAWLVATGPLTNVAVLFATFPAVAEHIAGLSFMGGAMGGDFTNVSVSAYPPLLGRVLSIMHVLHRVKAVKPSLFDQLPDSAHGSLTSNLLKTVDSRAADMNSGPKYFGNSTAFAEFNILADPEAARSILTNPVLIPKTTMIPLDVTHQAYATPQIQEMLLYGTKGATRLRRAFHELLIFFAETYDKVFGIKEGPPLHDPLAVAAVLSNHADFDMRIDFDDNGGERWDMDVTFNGPETGRTVYKKSEHGMGIRVPRSLDLDKFWRSLNECMAAADRATDYAQ